MTSEKLTNIPSGYNSILAGIYTSITCENLVGLTFY